MRQRKRFIGYGLFSVFALLTVAGAGVAHASPAHADRDQLMIFDDDLLDADLTAPFGDPVFSRHLPPARVMLIRPRTSFVPELYQTVEQI